MPVSRLKQYLDDHGVKYVIISHSPAYTMPEIAAKAHVPGKMVAKTVVAVIGIVVIVPVLHEHGADVVPRLQQPQCRHGRIDVEA